MVSGQTSNSLAQLISFAKVPACMGRGGERYTEDVPGVHRNILSWYFWDNTEKCGVGKDKPRRVINPLPDDTWQDSVFMSPDQTRKLHTAGRESQKVRWQSGFGETSRGWCDEKKKNRGWCDGLIIGKQKFIATKTRSLIGSPAFNIANVGCERCGLKGFKVNESS